MFGSSTQDCHAWRIYQRMFSADANHSLSQWRSRKPAIISSCSVLPPEIVVHDDAYIGGHSENNIKRVVHDDLEWKNQTTPYILPHYWLYDWFSQFRSCGTYSVLSRSHSIVRNVSVREVQQPHLTFSAVTVTLSYGCKLLLLSRFSVVPICMPSCL